MNAAEAALRRAQGAGGETSCQNGENV